MYHLPSIRTKLTRFSSSLVWPAAVTRAEAVSPSTCRSVSEVAPAAASPKVSVMPCAMSGSSAIMSPMNPVRLSSPSASASAWVCICGPIAGRSASAMPCFSSTGRQSSLLIPGTMSADAAIEIMPAAISRCVSGV